MVVHALEQPIDRVLDTLEHNPSYLPKSLYSISNNRDSHSLGHKDVTTSHTPLYHDQLRSLGSYTVLNYSKVVSTRLLLSLTIVNSVTRSLRILGAACQMAGNNGTYVIYRPGFLIVEEQ